MCTCLCIVQSWAQNRTITGKVTDGSGAPVHGASVTIKGTNTGTNTKDDGSFSLSIGDAAKTIIITSLNFQTQEISLAGKKMFNVQLQASDATSLDDIVIVGYQAIKKKDATGSVKIVDGQELTEKPIASITQLLQGKAAGVQVMGQSGKPGANAYIRIRGTGSINASSEPLIIMDGVSISSTAFNMINPDDVDDITILKDASATSIYGSRGSNGVILITSKKGKGAPVVSYSFQYGKMNALKLKHLDVMNAMQKFQYEFDGGYYNGNGILDSMISNRISNGTYAPGTTLLTMTNDQRQQLWSLATSRGQGDWRKAMLPTGTFIKHDASISGSSDKFRYYLSLSKANNEGTVYGSYFNTVGGRLNVEYNANSWLKMGTNLGVTNSVENVIREVYNGQAAYTSALLLNAYEPLYVNGKYNITSLGQNAMETTDDNPNVANRISSFATIYGEAKLLKHLVLRSQIGMNYNTLSQEYYLEPGSYLAQTLGYNQKRDNGNRDFVYVFTNTANWVQTLGANHNISGLIGSEFTKDKFYSYSLTARGFPTASVNTLENGATPTQATTSRSDWSLISYFAKAQYNYAKKYFIDLTARTDGSSRFGKNNRFANFWSVGATWDIKKETFFKVEPVSDLKLRASYGTAGNNNGIGNYQALGTYALNVSYNGSPAASPNNLANPDLTWEKAALFDVGIDFGILNNRITGTIEYYNKKTSSLLYNVNVSQTTGFSNYTGNVGSLRNRGIEVSLSGDIIKKKDFNWNVSVIYANNDNKVLELYSDNVPTQGGLALLKIGQPLYVYKLVRWAGVNPTDGKNQYYKIDGTLTESDPSSQAVMMNGKSPLVKFNGSINTSLSYKGIDLSAQLYYSGGNYIFNALYQIGASEGEQISKNQFTDALNYWKKSGDNVQMANIKDPSQRVTYDTDKYLEKGDYLSLRDITLGYTLPADIAQKIKFKSIRVYIQGTNLWMGTKFRGIPEVGQSNGENTSYQPGQLTLYGYPQYKAFTVGANIKF